MDKPKIYYRDDQATLWLGDALETLRELPTGSVNCVVTSPPYFGLRDYGTAVWVDADPICAHEMGDKLGYVCVRCGGVKKDRQYGLEASPAEYVETMRRLFAEARRVLADDGTLWLNLGDSYSSGQGALNTGFNERWHGEGNSGQRKQEKGRPSRRRDGAEVAAARRAVTGMPPKNLLMIPERTAMALQDDGWILRNKIVWHKTNAMPSSVTDRLSNRYEHLFLFSKSERYWFDLDAIREATAPRKYEQAPTWAQRKAAGEATRAGLGGMAPTRSSVGVGAHALGRNPGDVWSIATKPYPAAHFAVFPIDLPLRCIKAGCKPGGTVLDPFSGSGTTGAAARELDRRYVGIDLNASYHELAKERFAQGAFFFGDAS